ncbi:hypothetical protein [Actinoallomurus sp. NPDC052274]|uniref:hypothetical protein n=1 Tax=Actinoallomurus sp. NPDC052274 TaxID=3155420 RepID=UPI0034416F81
MSQEKTPWTATVWLTGLQRVENIEVTVTLTARFEGSQPTTEREPAELMLIERLINMTLGTVRLTSLRYDGEEQLPEDEIPEDEIEVHNGRNSVELHGRKYLDDLELTVTATLTLALGSNEPETGEEWDTLVNVITPAVAGEWGRQFAPHPFHGEVLLPQAR